MNKRQKIVQNQFLNNEEEVINRLKGVYEDSLKDIEKKAQALQDDIDRLGDMAKLATDADEKARLLSMQQSKIYQKQYQDSLKKQIGSVLDNMQVEEFRTVSEYLQKCYEDGFVGTMFDLQGQGIPLCFPMDQEAMVRAVQLDSKISNGLYSRLGEDVAMLKKRITAEVSRGIATGMSFQQVAKQLAGQTNIGYNNAVRIARTEGHRIQLQGAMDACHKAKEHGADVVKQWDSTLDSSTRESHVAVDGEIREIDEPFSNGLMFPGDPAGGAAEVINCRCALLQRARWALVEKMNPDTGELSWEDDEFTKMDGFTGELKHFKGQETYDEFKKFYFSDENVKYMKYAGEMEQKYGTKDWNKILGQMTEAEHKKFTSLSDARPIFEGIYKGQPIVKLNAGDYDKFKEAYLKKAKELQQAEAVFKPDYSCAMAKGFGRNHYDAMHGKVSNSPNSTASEVWKEFESDIAVGDAHHRGGAFARGDTVYLDIDKVAAGNSYSAPYQTAFHEGGHAIDSVARGRITGGKWGARHYSSAYKDGLFPETIKEEVEELVKAKGKELKALFKEHADDVEWFRANGFMSPWQTEPPKYSKTVAYKAIEKEVKGFGMMAYGDLSDILEGATGAKIQCGIGHGASYWKKRTYDGVSDGLATEAFAEMTSATFTNPESLEMIKKYLPKSYSVYEEMLASLL